MQPFFFQPLLKSTLWGGQEIIRLKQIKTDAENVGESWELSGVAGAATHVSEGKDKGLTICDLIDRYGAELVGQKNFSRFGNKFPLLVKFISAAQDLSIQVHPNDEIAHKMGHPYGKSEMWFIVGAPEETQLYMGFDHPLTPELYEKALLDGNFLDLLHTQPSAAGDCFFIPAGRIHSIGAGNLLIEIQQASDDTFRVYDFDRIGKDGKKRELHTEQAKMALNFNDCRPDPVAYDQAWNKRVPLVRCSAFSTRLGRLNQPFHAGYSDLDSFVVLVAYEGAAVCTDNFGNRFTLQAGASVLLPATTQYLEIEPKASFAFMEAFVE